MNPRLAGSANWRMSFSSSATCGDCWRREIGFLKRQRAKANLEELCGAIFASLPGSFAKPRAFAFTVAGTLALCLGANTAIYTVVDRLFPRPLPYPNASSLAMIVQAAEKGGISETDNSQTGQMWEIVRDHATFLDSAVYGMSSGVNLVAGGRVEYVEQQRVSANFFHVLGVLPQIGREFRLQEDVPGGPALAILSNGLRKRAGERPARFHHALRH